VKREECLLGTLSSMITLAICLIALCSLHGEQTAVAALSPQEDVTWITYTTTHGLPSDTVWGGVAVDHSGQVWAGFEVWGSGWDPLELVSRFDDATWTNYRLPGYRAFSLVADEDVYLSTWYPGPAGGLCTGLWWFHDGTWVNFTSTDGMIYNCVFAVAPEGGDRVWIASGLYNHLIDEHLNLLVHKGTSTKEDDEWTAFDLDPNHDPDNVRAIAVDSDGNRWFGASHGVWVLSADDSTWITYTSDLVSYVTDIAFDATGNVWFYALQGIVQFDGTTWAYYDSREQAIEANYEAILTSSNRSRVNPMMFPGLWMVEGKAGVWLIREDGWSGVAFYNGRAWTTYNHENSGLGSDRVRGIAVDQQGNVWVGTAQDYGDGDGGLSKFTPTPNFAVGASPSAFLLEPGDTAITGISVSLLRGWAPTATLDIAGLLPTMSAAFGSNPVTPTAHTWLTITTAPDTPFGSYPLAVTAAGAGTTRTTTVTLSVVPEVHRYYLPITSKCSL
jgi:Two component regulator propeller